MKKGGERVCINTFATQRKQRGSSPGVDMQEGRSRGRGEGVGSEGEGGGEG